MAASENLRRELGSIEARIEELREILFRMDADFRAVQGRVGWLRTLQIRALKVNLERQIRELKQRREATRRCLAEARRFEEWLRFSGWKEGTEHVGGTDRLTRRIGWG